MQVLTPARLRGATLLGALLLVALPYASQATESAVVARTQEYDLKAAFLFNFARFVDWPPEAFADAAAPITIGVLGDDPFGSSLDDIVANELVHGRALSVRRYASVEDVGACQILFICPSQAGRWEQIAARLGKRSILTVGDGIAFTDHAGMIGFEMQRKHLRLRINLAAARAAKLTISSQLLRQATLVGPEAER